MAFIIVLSSIIGKKLLHNKKRVAGYFQGFEVLLQVPVCEGLLLLTMSSHVALNIQKSESTVNGVTRMLARIPLYSMT